MNKIQIRPAKKSDCPAISEAGAQSAIASIMDSDDNVEVADAAKDGVNEEAKS